MTLKTISVQPDRYWYVAIAFEDSDRVFDEFERAADEDIHGTGLGLAIVKELCRVLSDQIDFVSREGVGTTFEIRFPLILQNLNESAAGHILE